MVAMQNPSFLPNVGVESKRSWRLGERGTMCNQALPSLPLVVRQHMIKPHIQKIFYREIKEFWIL
jgi:hypothetical protein